MTNPTSNFGWQMPTPTDLVTDLPADFEVFGQAVDTSMADLKGGTTGQILSKATNTDMDFTWITNDVGDITAVNVTAPITGGGTSGAVTIGVSAASTSVSGVVQLSDSTSTTSSVLAATPTAVKAAYDKASTAATTSVAGIVQLSDSTSTTSSVLASTPTATKSAYDLAASAYAPAFTNNYFAGKNRLINGALQIWQRGTSFTTVAAYTYCTDRWYYSTASGGKTVSRQATSDTTNLPTIQYCVRLARNTGQTDTTGYTFYTALESVNSIPLAGQNVVLSFYARKGANYSGTTVATYINTGTGDQAATGQNAGTWTGFTSPLNGSTFTPTTTWTRYTFTATIGATATQIGVGFITSAFSGTAGAADYLEITGLQLEAGSTATPFQTASGSIAGELALCQRYYYRTTAGTSTGDFAQGQVTSVTNVNCVLQLPVTTRVPAVTIDYPAMSNFVISDATSTANPTSITLNQATSNSVSLSVVYLSFTVGRIGRLYANGTTSAYIGVSAEL